MGLVEVVGGPGGPGRRSRCGDGSCDGIAGVGEELEAWGAG